MRAFWREWTIGASDYDWRAAVGVAIAVSAYLLGRVADLPEGWAAWIRGADVLLGAAGVLLAAQGRPIARVPVPQDAAGDEA